MSATDLDAPAACHAGQPQNADADLGGDCTLPIDIPEAFVAEILRPYRPNAKYLKSAQIIQVRDAQSPARAAPILTASGRFAIPESCYIDDTGHFNAVEFNICYNQLAYVMFGKCFETGIVPKLRFLTPCEYRRHQLQSCFIVSLESRFLKQLKSGDFRGDLVLNKLSWTGGVLFCFTTIAFSDCEGVKAQGPVVLAFNPPAGATRH
jgi:hypothetical protein